MLEEILDPRNVEKARRQVMSNGGAAGIDGMQTHELAGFLNAGWQRWRMEILEGNYRPAAVRKAERYRRGRAG